MAAAVAAAAPPPQTPTSKFPVKREEPDDDFQEEFGRGCCFRFPCFRSGHSSGGSSWERIASTPSKDDTTSSSGWDLLGKGIKGLKKIREWSELVAGPKWKTFIRRFNRNRGGGGGGSKNGVKFQYDPFSYAMNFDEGPGQHCEDDDRLFRDFSSRYAAIPITSNKS